MYRTYVSKFQYTMYIKHETTFFVFNSYYKN